MPWNEPLRRPMLPIAGRRVLGWTGQGVSVGRFGRWPEGKTALTAVPLILAAVLVIFAAHTAGEALRSYQDLQASSSQSVILAGRAVAEAASDVLARERKLEAEPFSRLAPEDIAALRGALSVLAATCRRATADAALAADPQLSGAARAVSATAESFGARVGSDTVDKGALHDGLEAVIATVGPLTSRLNELGARMIVERSEMLAACVAAMNKLFLSLLGAVLSMLLLVWLHRRATCEAEYRADHDGLTGLVARGAFERWVEDRDARGDRRPIAVIVLDLDDFKQINDELGHAAGDGVLRAFVGRLGEAFGAEALLVRWGGDEFTVVLPLDGYMQAGAISMLRAAFGRLETRVTVEATTVNLRCSAGAALFPADGVSLSETLQLADLALFRAKARGKARLQFYDREMLAERHKVIALRDQLRAALAEGRLELYWQPQVDTVEASVPSAEALVRWVERGSGEIIPPGHFIPAVEATDLIIELDHFVLDSAVRTAARWNRLWSRPPTVAVNVSAFHFQQREFVGVVSETLRRHGLPPGRLELEITEGVILGENDEVRRNLEGLARLGVRIALDDFGTGYSNIAYLLQLQPNRLKIDQTFTRDIVESEQMKSLVSAIVGIGRVIDCEIVAEGVETREQLAVLQKLGCRVVQGYYFARPMPAAQFERWRDGARSVGDADPHERQAAG